MEIEEGDLWLEHEGESWLACFASVFGAVVSVCLWRKLERIKNVKYWKNGNVKAPFVSLALLGFFSICIRTHT